jgi:putative endonuclease
MFWKSKRAAASPPEAALKTRRATGDHGESRALAHLQRHGLTLVERNYRVARGRSRPAGEIDLVLSERDGTLVFVEVRVRSSQDAGGAAASVTHGKRTRLIYAAQHYLQRFDRLPPCRFDVVAIDGEDLQWLRGAFDAA